MLHEQNKSYPGGKNGSGVYQSLINLMPPHDVYIESFLGAGAVLRHKRPAARSIGIDLDPAALARWRGDEVPGLKLMHGDARTILPGCIAASGAGGSRTLVYCDPPYLLSTRRAHRRIYRCEILSDKAHSGLLKLFVALPCMVMVSGYRSELYDKALASWRRAEFYTTNRAGARVLECVWMNYPEPDALHDYQFLGDGFRERARIKKKKDRWKAKLERMPVLERQAVFSAVEEVRRDRNAASGDTGLGL